MRIRLSVFLITISSAALFRMWEGSNLEFFVCFVGLVLVAIIIAAALLYVIHF